MNILKLWSIMRFVGVSNINKIVTVATCLMISPHLIVNISYAGAETPNIGLTSFLVSRYNRLRLCNGFIVPFIRDIFILTYDLTYCCRHWFVSCRLRSRWSLIPAQRGKCFYIRPPSTLIYHNLVLDDHLSEISHHLILWLLSYTSLHLLSLVTDQFN